MSSEEITVSVNSYGGKRPLSLVYFDPVSGKKIAKSSGTRDWREAERLAGELEKELLAGEYKPASKVTWKEFRERYEAEKLPRLSRKTGEAFKSAANHLERVLNPDRLCKLTPKTLARFIASLRTEGMSEVTIGSNCRHLRAALAWAAEASQGLLPKVPEMDIPPPGESRGRPITAEEVDRMVAAAEKCRKDDFDAWQFYIRGLFYSGLRLEESTILSWDENAPFAVDLTGGRRPAFKIAKMAQKARRSERLPMTEEFFNLLMEVPEAERQGSVFKLNGLLTRCPITPKRICRIVAKIGKTAGVVVAIGEKRKRVDGKLVTVPTKKYASAHDVRRGFCYFWSHRVDQFSLMRLARHRQPSTTAKYYLVADADTIGDELFGRKWESGNPGNTFGNTRPKTAPKAETAPVESSTEAIETKDVT
jgi:hypothetical protein